MIKRMSAATALMLKMDMAVRTVTVFSFCGEAKAAWARVGKMAVAMAMPMKLTGTLWKLRAKLRVVIEPWAKREAMLVNTQKVTSSTGWPIIFGAIKRKVRRISELPHAHTILGRQPERRESISLTRRCSIAPKTVPQATPVIRSEE